MEKWSPEFSSWNTSIRGVPIVVWWDGNIEFDSDDDGGYISFTLAELHELVEETIKYCNARIEYKKEHE
jgi:hypothetical protein